MRVAGRGFDLHAIRLAAAGALLGATCVLAAPRVSAGEAEAAREPTSPRVAALGRLEPEDGVRHVAGPSLMTVVVSRILVEEGDRVEEGQVIALLDEIEIREAALEQAQAQLANAEAELRRNTKLHESAVISDSMRDALRLRVQVARAELHRAEAELERCRVRAPIAGQVLVVHARDGERVGSDGILELGRTEAMFAVAEVYESDIQHVRIGQRASVASPSLGHPLHGSVARIGLKVGKMDVLGTDPAARTDARVVEVKIRLDPADVAAAAALTNLQVEIEIEP